MVSLDERDLQLLSALYRDGRASNKALARQLGLSQTACLARTRALIKAGFIARFRADLAFARLGAFEAWLDVRLSDACGGAAGAFEAFARTQPEIGAFYVLAAPGQVRLQVVTEDYDACEALARRLTARTDLVAEARIVPIFKASVAADAFPNAVLNSLAQRLRFGPD